MKQLSKISSRGAKWLCAIILLSAGCLFFTFSSCKQQNKKKPEVKNKNVYYTCSMHPQVHEEHSGNCPICGMKLIAVSKTTASVTTQIQLSAEQIRLGNILTDTIGKENIGNRIVLTGTLNFNQNELSSVNARVEGRIEKLYFKNVGDYVQKGAKLYDLYSEQLNNAKQEYVNAVQQESSIGNTLINYGALVESAKNKLRLWGMSDTHVKELSKSKVASTLTSFYSSEAGYIKSFDANEGDYVMEGGSVLQLANLTSLWAEAQVYSTQMSSITNGENVSVQIPDVNNMIINGTISFVNPEVNPDARINLLRVTIPVKNTLLHPGMVAYIIINKEQHSSMTLPVGAVLMDAKGSTVWVQVRPGIYEIRMVQTGITNSNEIEITSGFKPGDAVVTSGAYLLNSEYIFEHGSDPMAGMKM